MEQGTSVLCISIDKHLAEPVIRRLREKDLINADYLITRINGNVIIPVKTLEGLNELLSNTRYYIIQCNPPPSRRKYVTRVPSYDLVGDAAIIRENVLGFMSGDEVVRELRSIHPNIRAIYVKEETVDKYRIPKLRLLWGEHIDTVVVKEYGLLFKVSLGKVYYNPRLGEEHHRIALMVRNGELVVDLFTGIGGFPIHISSLKAARIIANDLNPEAYRLLCENILLNHRRLRGGIIPLNLDAREIIDYLDIYGKADRVIANLPRWSLEFTKVYNAVLKPGGILHLYILTYDREASVIELGSKLPGWSIQGSKLVLEYAPRAGIYRFDLVKPKDI
ncbi:MAG: class I SAM-dependent methyltransferase [Desulfurococcus sp.]|uniref:class I SAM-dependent methyltransferase n=1 Tax=Desulfurococcus sp. TaxID=51678 RepID=UPI003D0F4A8F